MAQQYAAASQVKVVTGTPVSPSHTFSVLSQETDTARRAPALTATPETQSEWPAKVRGPTPRPEAPAWVRARERPDQGTRELLHRRERLVRQETPDHL